MDAGKAAFPTALITLINTRLPLTALQRSGNGFLPPHSGS
jgi:hypothetical protein